MDAYVSKLNELKNEHWIDGWSKQRKFLLTADHYEKQIEIKYEVEIYFGETWRNFTYTLVI